MHRQFLTATSRIFVLAALTLIISCCFAPANAETKSTDNEWKIQIDLPAEQIFDMAVTEIIPTGLIYLPESLSITGSAANPDIILSGANDGNSALTIIWKFGDIDNSNNEDVDIRFHVAVANVDRNQEGTILSAGKATLNWKDSQGNPHVSSDESRTIRVIEPDLALERSFSPSSGWSGDEIACTLKISHTAASTAPAYDVDLRDALPAGLEYVPGSAEIVRGPAGSGLSGSDGPAWSIPELDGSWSGEQKVELSYMARIADHLPGQDNLTCRAELYWTSTSGENPQERSYTRSSQAAVRLDPPAPQLQIGLTDSPDPLAPGGRLNYTISYANQGGPAEDTRIEASWDPSLIFLSANPAPDQGSENAWSLGRLPGNNSGSIQVSLQAPADAAEGLVLSASALISAAASPAARASATTTIEARPSRLFIEKRASDEIISPGGALNYTITFGNNGESPASNVSITDIVDKSLVFQEDSCTPAPSRIWSEGDGTHLFWNSTALSAGSLAPGEGGSISFSAQLPADPAHPDFDWVYNRYKIDSDHSSGAFQSLQTAVVHSLFVRKKSDREMYMRGETVNYTITYGNELAIEARKARLTDTLPDVEFLEAHPEPSFNNGSVLVWNLGTLPPNSTGTIQLYARINQTHSDIVFQGQQSVSGEGYMQMHQDLSTAKGPKTLTNHVRIDALFEDRPDWDASSATIGLLDSLGTEVKLRGHGSGSYAREEETLLKTNNSTISLSTSLSARYRPSSFSLPGGREIGYSSKWHDSTQSKNRITDASTLESYRYASRLDRNSTLLLDKNGSTLESETSFEGAGHIGLFKGSPPTSINTSFSARKPAFESSQAYLGSFTVYTKFDEYGKSAAEDRSVSGTGYASSDQRVSDRQRSYEHGAGLLSVEDTLQTASNYLSKDINASYSPQRFRYTPEFEVNLSGKWSEGMWSRSGSCPADGSNSSGGSNPASFIGEEFSELDFLQKSTEAIGLNEMKTEAEFQGQARFTAQYINQSPNGSEELDLYDEYLGRYSLSRHVQIGGVASFDEPHLSVSKEGRMEPAGGTFVYYTITVKNDGNRALGPVYIQDLFPPGTEYVRSSLRPSQISAASCQWTLISLGIGQSSSIDLVLNSSDEEAGLINRVLASGSYDGEYVKAENYSALQFGWLECCPSELLAAKTARVDASDPILIHYRISLRNRESYAMALTIKDELPEGISFVNSTTSPAEHTGSLLTWNIAKLGPGEVQNIDYLARAHRSGIFTAPTHIEAWSNDGSRILSADISAQVYVPGDVPPQAGSDWQPPTCFDLNCTTMGGAENWIPCVSCSAAQTAEMMIDDEEFMEYEPPE